MPHEAKAAATQRSEFKAAVLIPCYRHGRALRQVLSGLTSLQLPVYVVDDGNEEDEAQLIREAVAQAPGVTLIVNPHNLGKGGAVCAAARAAWADGFTHALQVDADGQHNLADAPALLELARQHPGDLALARPVYNDSVPKGRLYGRKITNFWVAVETLSWEIKDAMCGFRVYPLASFIQVIDSSRLGLYMDFDIEILVRLYWLGLKPYYLDSQVSYPQDGVSSFRMLEDNLQISKLHTKLFLLALTHYPALLRRKLNRKSEQGTEAYSESAAATASGQEQAQWATQRESRGLWGMRLMIKCYDLGGFALFKLLLYPVIACYWALSPEGRRCSRLFLDAVTSRRRALGLKAPALYTFPHFYHFGLSMLTKIAAWRGDLKLNEQVHFAGEAKELMLSHTNQGCLIVGSHLGDLETLRAVESFQHLVTINALVFTDNARRFKQIMQEFAPSSQLNLIAVNEIGPDTAALLQEKTEQGQWVAILGDRVPVKAGRGGVRAVQADFLGQRAPFPQGPYVLASLLKCPVLMIHGLREGGTISIHCRKLAQKLVLQRGSREADLTAYAQLYAQNLEELALRYPYEWFNFYDFWHPLAAEGA
ncbi:MAG: glycosyltransferase family 2 protein [Succinivibrio sp.]|nr:glycosyltransferase family 2 protein [Succinivibrio sp.]